jgi:hypothetical protein
MASGSECLDKSPVDDEVGPRDVAQRRAGEPAASWHWRADSAHGTFKFLKTIVSTDYYTRLEQGRNIHPSRAVLDSVARALLVGEARLSVSRFARTPRQRRRRGVGAYKAAKYASGTLVG